MQKIKYSIGEMAAKNNTTTKTLRYYDKIDLFKPKILDPATNYRYYTHEQINRLDLILYLKGLGVSLTEIKDILKDHTPENHIKHMRSRLIAIEDDIRRLKRMREHIKYDIKETDQLVNFDRSTLSFEVSIIEKATQKVSTVDVVQPYSRYQIDDGVKTLINRFDEQRLSEKNIQKFGEIDRIVEDRYDTITLFYEDDKKGDKDIFGGRYLTISHIGEIGKVEKPIAEIENYAKVHDIKLDDKVVKIFLVSPFLQKDDEHIVQIYQEIIE